MATTTAPRPETSSPDGVDHMPLHGVDHVELWVGNALQSAYFYAHAFGFRRVAYRGLETGSRDRVSYVLQSGRIRLVLTGALSSNSPITAHHLRHGDGVKVIALGVPDARHAYEEALRRGARGIDAPLRHDATTTARSRSPRSPRTETPSTCSSSVANTAARSCRATPRCRTSGPTRTRMLLALDHIVGNVELGHMNEWVHFYERVFGMTEMLHFADEAISTEYSALMSKVVSNGNGRIKFPINEPAEGKRKSQIDEYLDYYEGAGAQHLAVATRDIVETVKALRARGVEFLTIPDSYYDEVPARVPAVADQLSDLRAQGILVDQDDEGYLLQIFTKPVGDRPTVFFEIIERHGARGFGEGNFKALFEAIEREQDRRGNL